MNLLDLVLDVDYQKSYSYEKRVDLFNKYGISTAMKFLVPIWGLSEYILEHVHHFDYYSSSGERFWEYGHGQQLLQIDLYEKLRKAPVEGAIDTRRIRPYTKKIDIWRHIKGIEPHPTRGTMRKVISFSNEDKTLSVNNYHYLSMCTIPRDIYDRIDQWLIDFGFSKWQDDV